MTPLAAASDPRLFGDHFDSPSWEPWRAFLGALAGLPLPNEHLEVFRACTGRLTPPTAPFKEAALICGRRAGKSRVLALLGACAAVLRDYRPLLSAGEVATVAILAADRRQARTIFRYVVGLLESVPAMKDAISRTTDEVIELPSRRVNIEITTASFRGTRGYTYAAVLCDEIAFWRSDESANPDQEIITAIRPGLMTIPGAPLLMASSPYARRGLLYETFKRHYGKDDAPILVWKAPTWAMNPRITRADLDDDFDADPERASAEFAAEFRSDLASFVTREVLEACTAGGRSELLPSPGTSYCAFVDPSGGSADAMTVAIAHLGPDGHFVLDAVRERKPPFSPEAVTADFASLLRTYGITTVTGDRYAGEWPRERFRVHGIAYELSERPKSDIYRDLLPLLNAGRAELLDNRTLLNQLAALERRTARGGRDSIDHPPAMHDDLANAAAGALLLASAYQPMITFSAADIRRIAIAGQQQRAALAARRRF